MRQLRIVRHRKLNIFSALPTAALALSLLSACSAGGDAAAVTSNGNAGGSAASPVHNAGTTATAPASSGSSGASTVTASNPYDAAMQKLTQASSYHFVLTTDVKAGGDASKPSHSVADGVYARSNKAMQFKLDTDAEYSQPGEWIVIGNGKQAYHKQNGAWTNQGFITPPGVGFSLHTLLTVITLRNATASGGNAAPSPVGSENIDGQDCDHYRITLPEQSYDVYLSKASGDVVRAELTNPTQKQTLSISHINEPVNVTPPI